MMNGRRGRAAYATLRALPVAALVAAFAQQVQAEDAGLGKQPGTVLLARCEPALRLLQAGHRLALDDHEYARAQSCIGFVDGFLFGHGWAAWREHRDMYYCPPEGFSVSVAVPVLVEYLWSHDERLDAPAHLLLFTALSHAFPCTPRD